MKLQTMLVLLVVTIAGCSSVSVTNQWKDPSWHGPPASSVVVVGISRSEAMRRVFEDAFVTQLQASGVKAVQGYSQVAAGADGNKVNELIKSSSADAVVVARVVRVQQKVNVSPGPAGPVYGGFYGWYGSAWASTPTITQYDVVTVETDVWDPRADKLVWSVQTQNIGTRDVPGISKELAQTLIPKMKADGILP